MSRTGIGLGTVLATACGLALVWGPLVAPSRAGAQGQTTLDVRLERAWFGPDSPLVVEVEVRNASGEPLERGRVSAALYERVRSRSELAGAFAGELPATPLEAFTFRLPEVPPGGARTLRIEDGDLAAEAFDDAPDGLYPLSVGVRRSTGPALAETVTAVAFLGSAPARPLELLPVVVAGTGPVLDPATGEALPGADGAGPSRILDVLAEETSASSALVVPPITLRELDVIARENPDAPPVPALPPGPGRLLQTPATWARLPDLDDVAGELEAGRRLLSDRLGSETAPVVYPPDLLLDDGALDELPDDVDAVLVDGTLLGETNVTPARPVRTGGVLLLPTDRTLGDATTSSEGDLDVGRAVAETAMVYFERPGTRRTLAVTVEATPAGAAFVRALEDAPWLRLLSAAEAVGVEAREADPAFPDVAPPPNAYRRAVGGAEVAIEELESYTLPGNPLVERLRVALAVARSTALWDDDWDAGSRYARDVVDVVRAQRRLVEISETAVTFTSRRGEIPVSVISRADYPVRLRIELSSPKVRFPEGASTVVDDLRPPGETVTFPAVTESSGTFPLTVALTDPDGRAVLDQRELVVRSAAVNTLALVVTSAAALFLVLWYGRRVIRRSRTRDHHPAGEGDRDA